MSFIHFQGATTSTTLTRLQQLLRVLWSLVEAMQSALRIQKRALRKAVNATLAQIPGDSIAEQCKPVVFCMVAHQYGYSQGYRGEAILRPSLSCMQLSELLPQHACG